jgi:hypothetical protein
MIAVGLAEATLRVFPTLQVQKEPQQIFCSAETRRHVPSAEFGYSEVPGNVYFEKASAADDWYFVKINSEGFRDNYNSGSQNVIVLGDSLVRGTLVEEQQQFGYLLDLWHPDIAFRTYGVGGYGQVNELRLYESLARIPHKLVILAYSTATDLDDNAERASLVGGTMHLDVEPRVETPPKSVLGEVHHVLWANTALYPLLFRTVLEPFVGRQDARRNIDKAFEMTRRLLGMIADEARLNGAELLVVSIPGWNEVAGRYDGMEYDRQHKMLEEFAATTPSVSLLDATPTLARDYELKYGLTDKHLNGYGQFLVATAIDRWLATQWTGGPHSAPAPHHYSQTVPIVPDCAMANEYARQLEHPIAQQ